MQGYDLVKDMGLIDDDLLEGALVAKAAPGGWRAPSRWLAAAACVAVAALVGWGAWQAGTKTAPPVAGEEGEAGKPSPVPVIEEAEAEIELVELNEEPVVIETEPIEEPIEIEVEQPEVSGGMEVAETEPLPTDETSSAFLPNITDPDVEAYPTTTMIEDYPGDDMEACYDMAVNNGAVAYSVPLQDAMAEYGDTVLYRVYVDIFKDGVQLAPDDPEVTELMTSLIDQGIVSAIETTYQDKQPVATYNTLHATYDQLQQFQADSAHGWMLWLYAERV